MTKEFLEQYPDICGELEEIQSSDFGLIRNEKKAGKLICDKIAIEAFISTLPWGKRKLVKAVLKHGPRWDVVRRELHSLKSPDALRMEYSRIFQCPMEDEKI